MMLHITEQRSSMLNPTLVAVQQRRRTETLLLEPDTESTKEPTGKLHELLHAAGR